MKKAITLSANPLASVRMRNMANMLGNCLYKPLELLAGYYSAVLGRRIGNRLTLELLNAQLAFFSVVCSAEAPLMTRILFLTWLTRAFIRCKARL